MDRRAFLGALGLLAAPVAAEAQRPGKTYRIGYLGVSPPSGAGTAFAGTWKDRTW